MFEFCDDGNMIEGDGCNNGTIEEGWSCTLDNFNKSVCLPTCGDGCILMNEECDPPSSEGCTSSCKLVDGYEVQYNRNDTTCVKSIVTKKIIPPVIVQCNENCTKCYDNLTCYECKENFTLSLLNGTCELNNTVEIIKNDTAPPPVSKNNTEPNKSTVDKFMGSKYFSCF